MPLTALSMRNDVWMDGIQVNGQDLRLEQTGAFLTGASPSGSTGIAARPGVRYGTGDPLKISASSGMTLSVNAGIAWVQGSAAANSGMYTGCLDTAGTVTLATSDPTNPRIDNIIVQVIDNGDGTSTTKVTPQTGTPAASPSAPTLPANSLLLAQVAVAASASSIVAGNITDKRVWTVSTGGILPMANVTGGISGMAGLYADDLSTGRLKRSDGSGNARAPKTVAFAPIYSSTSSPTITGGNTSTVASITQTVDGVTEVEMTLICGQITQNSGSAGARLFCSAFVDGVLVPTPGANAWAAPVSGSGYAPPLNHRAWTTPAAGSRVFTFFVNSPDTGSWTLNNCLLRIAANPA